jgi:hypothetical protein
MKTEAIIREIDGIVKWYARSKPTGADIIEAYKKLTGYLWFFAEIVTEAKNEYNNKYYIRKIETARTKMNLVKSKLAVNKAEIEAILTHETDFMMEVEAESVVYRADLLLKQGNRVAECMRTEISFLKQEKQQSADPH